MPLGDYSAASIIALNLTSFGRFYSAQSKSLVMFVFVYFTVFLLFVLGRCLGVLVVSFVSKGCKF